MAGTAHFFASFADNCLGSGTLEIGRSVGPRGYRKLINSRDDDELHCKLGLGVRPRLHISGTAATFSNLAFSYRLREAYAYGGINV